MAVNVSDNGQPMQQVDFNYPERYINTIPVSCEINGMPFSIPQKSSWKKLLIAITEKFVGENNKAVAELWSKPLYYRTDNNGKKIDDGPFLSLKKHHEKSWWIKSGSSGGWINIGFSSTGIIKIIKLLCLRCGITMGSVRIFVRSANNDTTEQVPTNKEEMNSSLPSDATTDNYPRTVDFNHPELCSGCDPETCVVGGIRFQEKNWRDLLVSLTEFFLISKPQALELYSRNVNLNGDHPFLLKDKPVDSARQIGNGYWIKMPWGIKDLVCTIGQLCTFCGVNLADVEITYISKPNAYPPGMLTGSSPPKVDFDHPELCSGCDPMSCIVEGVSFSGRNWRDLLVALTDYFLTSKPKAQELYTRSVYPNGERPFLLKDKPNASSRQIANGYWLFMNMNIKSLVFTIGSLCRFCGVSLADVEITYTPKGNVNFAAMKNECENTDKAIMQDKQALSAVLESLLFVLREDYTAGFRFDSTAIRLLSVKSGVEIDAKVQSELERHMFHRSDGIYFLFECVTDQDTQADLLKCANSWLDEYNCFEVPVLYELYGDRLNGKIITSASDFEDYYDQINNRNVRCVAAPYIGNRIARFNNVGVWDTFEEIAGRMIKVIVDEYYGSCNEDDLQISFSAFSTELLGKIIKHRASDELIRVEINESVCYQTFDALGLPENFSEVLAYALERLRDIGLEPTQDTLHTTLSLELGVNFMAEYNLPDWDIYRRLITSFYKAEPRREWKSNIFGEIVN